LFRAVFLHGREACQAYLPCNMTSIIKENEMGAEESAEIAPMDDPRSEPPQDTVVSMMLRDPEP